MEYLQAKRFILRLCVQLFLVASEYTTLPKELICFLLFGCDFRVDLEKIGLLFQQNHILDCIQYCNRAMLELIMLGW